MSLLCSKKENGSPRSPVICYQKKKAIILKKWGKKYVVVAAMYIRSQKVFDRRITYLLLKLLQHQVFNNGGPLTSQDSRKQWQQS